MHLFHYVNFMYLTSRRDQPNELDVQKDRAEQFCTFVII